MPINHLESPTPRGGVLIVDPRDQSTVKTDLRAHVETSDWEWKPQAAYLYRWAVTFKDRLLDPVLLTDRRRMPDPVVSFDKMRVEALAAYRLVRNPQGLLDEITFNTAHFIDGNGSGIVWRYGQWGLLETLLHEQIHLWQQNFGTAPVKPGKPYHNGEFVGKCESLGLHPRLGSGAHYKPADGVFAAIMAEHGIERPPEIEAEGRLDWWDLLKDLLGGTPTGRSSLHKWECPDCGLKLRVGVGKDIEVACMPCTRIRGQTVLFTRSA